MKGSPDRDGRLFWLGVGLWVAVIALTWPNALSIGDEVAYVGQAKVFLAGHVRYVPHSPGVWWPSPHGPFNKYPLLQSLILMPFLAVAPRAVFLVAIIAAIALATTARAILVSWGKSPLWALLLLAYPTVVILSRTVMADVTQTAAVLGAWWALRRGRAAATILWTLLLVAIKATGPLLAAGIFAGEALASGRDLRARDGATWRRFGWAVLGGTLGLVVTLISNYLANGTPWFGYAHGYLGTPPFWYTYFPHRAPAYLLALFLNPPLLIAGAWTLWRRRELGLLALCGGYIALMCFYYFLDTSPNRIEAMVLSPRLILPAVVFLLLGYGAWLEGVARRLLGSRAFGADGRLRPWLCAVLVALPVTVCAGVSARHASFQAPMGRALAIASGVADARGHELGLTENATKMGILYHGRVSMYDETNQPAVVLCNEGSASHRFGGDHQSCALAGYHEIGREAGLVVLARPEGHGP